MSARRWTVAYKILLPPGQASSVPWSGFFRPLVRLLPSPGQASSVPWSGFFRPLVGLLLSPGRASSVPWSGFFCPLVGLLPSPSRASSVPWSGFFRLLVGIFPSMAIVSCGHRPKDCQASRFTSVRPQNLQLPKVADLNSADPPLRRTAGATPFGQLSRATAEP
jgi:hypothetical protein